MATNRRRNAWEAVGKALGLPETPDKAGSPGKEEAMNGNKDIWVEAATSSSPDDGVATEARRAQVREMIAARTKPSNVLDVPLEGEEPTTWFSVHEGSTQTEWGPRFALTGGQIGPTKRSEELEKPDIFGHFSVGGLFGKPWSSKKAGYYWHLVMDDAFSAYLWQVIKANQGKAVQVLVYAPNWEYDTVEDPESGERILKTYPNKQGTLIAAGRLNKVTTRYFIVIAEAGSHDPNYRRGDNVVTAAEELSNCGAPAARKPINEQIARSRQLHERERNAVEKIAAAAGLTSAFETATRRTPPDKVSDFEPNSER